MVGPARLASGRDADVFVVGRRRYRNGGDVAAEALLPHQDHSIIDPEESGH